MGFGGAKQQVPSPWGEKQFKPGRSTLDPKKGYKTKTGSTSSVTLTLTRCGSMLPILYSPRNHQPPSPQFQMHIFKNGQHDVASQ